MDPGVTDSGSLSCECSREENSLSCSISADCQNPFSFHIEGQKVLVSSCIPLRNEQSSESHVAECVNSCEGSSKKCVSLPLDTSKEKTVVSNPPRISVQRRGLASRIPILSKSDVAVQYRNSQRKLRSISEDFSEGSFLVVNELKDPDTEPPFSRSREGSLGR